MSRWQEGCHDGRSDGCDGGGVTVIMAAMVWMIGSPLESAGVHWTSSGWTLVDLATGLDSTGLHQTLTDHNWKFS